MFRMLKSSLRWRLMSSAWSPACTTLMSAPGFTLHDDVVEIALPEDAGSGGGVGQPDGVVQIVSPWGRALAAQHADHQEGRVADEHVLAQRIGAGGEQVLRDGLADRDDLGIAFHVFRREEHAGLRRPVVHLRKVLAGSDRRDHASPGCRSATATTARLRDGHGDARHAARWTADPPAGSWSRCRPRRAYGAWSALDCQQIGSHGLDAFERRLAWRRCRSPSARPPRRRR